MCPGGICLTVCIHIHIHLCLLILKQHISTMSHPVNEAFATTKIEARVGWSFEGQSMNLRRNIYSTDLNPDKTLKPNGLFLDAVISVHKYLALTNNGKLSPGFDEGTSVDCLLTLYGVSLRCSPIPHGSSVDHFTTVRLQDKKMPMQILSLPDKAQESISISEAIFRIIRTDWTDAAKNSLALHSPCGSCSTVSRQLTLFWQTNPLGTVTYTVTGTKAEYCLKMDTRTCWGETKQVIDTDTALAAVGSHTGQTSTR